MPKIEDMKKALKETPPKGEIELVQEVLPDAMVVGIEGSPEEYVEKEALRLSSELSSMAKDEAETIEEYTRRLSWILSQIAEEDAEKIKGVIADEREHQIIFTALSEKYDEAGVGKDAIKALEKLTKVAKEGK